MRRRLDLVGVDEIAERLGVSRSTVSQWIARGWPAGRKNAVPVPAPELLAVISGRISVYDWPDVKRWAKATGRLS